MEKLRAPFSDAAIAQISLYQTTSDRYKPLVCSATHVFEGQSTRQVAREELDVVLSDAQWRMDKPRLIPTRKGMICPFERCDHIVYWVWMWIADGRFKDPMSNHHD